MAWKAYVVVMTLVALAAIPYCLYRLAVLLIMALEQAT